MNRLTLLSLGVVFFFVLQACTSEDVAGPPAAPVPDSVKVGLARALPGFGDAPVEGVLWLQPPDESGRWRYAIDLDDDGENDIGGALRPWTQVPYRFTTIGIHRIQVRLWRDDVEETLERVVAVNDPGMTRVLAKGSVAGESGAQPLYGIVAGQEAVFAASFPGRARIYRFDPQDLRLEGWSEPEIPPGSDLLDLDLSPEGDRLYAGADTHHLFILSPMDLRLLLTISDPQEYGWALVEAVQGGVYAGESGLAFIDRGGTIVRRNLLDGAGPFTLSADESLLAVVDGGNRGLPDRMVRLLDATTFEILWTRPLPAGEEADFVAFSPSGDRVLAFAHRTIPTRPEAMLMVHTLDARTGAILRTTTAVPYARSIVITDTSPIAVSADRRWVALSTQRGLYIVDAETGLIHHRTELSVGCCNVAAAATGSDFYLSVGMDVVKLGFSP